MSKLSNVWVFSDAASSYPELIAAGQQLGETVTAIVLGSPDDIANAFALGAGAVYHLGDKNDTIMVEDYDATIASALSRAEGPPTLLLLDTSKRSKALAAKISGLLDAGLINDVTDISIENQSVKASHMMYGGLALAEENIHSKIAVVTLSAGLFTPQLADVTKSGQAQILPFVPPVGGIQCKERRVKQGNRVNLNKATRVIGIGRGIASQSDIDMVAQLCGVLGAELGCSRPIAEGEKWMDRDRYIGVSGVMIKPELYIAMGISGQIQHMVGVNGTQTIIAINKDKNAPIFQYCDYGMVGDIYKVVPALITAFKR
ncbi:FAD-binding protein [Budvicia aquatica]|uniref:Electron transfer flavoprotein subunit alpha n=1 Tax=Budvicia aquatica TaxID=82979 RepID=A0A2C6DBH7_9GAMM|nr:FAD-binding protein [Budvicia aquatica]PHI28566.1 electron transfer flavoprotein subunit alpha [Budvicia aquatica]